PKMKKLLAACGYGNQDISGGLTKFWLDSSLKISAQEQADFLERLYTNKLPFSARSMEIVRGLLMQKKGKGWTFSGKTGTAATNGKTTLGWFVGHLRAGDRQYVFAANIQGNGGPTGPATKDLVFQILQDLGLMPEPGS